MPATLTEQRLNHLIDLATKATSLERWDTFIRDLKVPGDFMPAILTQRPELFSCITPRTLNEEEMRALTDAFAGLIETNRALQNHAAELASMVAEWTRMFRGIMTVGRRIEHFANFRNTEESDDDF